MKFISIHSVPRSGSSWLLSIFNSHPNIKGIYQPLFSYKFKNNINSETTIDDFNNFKMDLLDTDDAFCNMKSDFHIENGLTKYNFISKNINNIVIKNVRYHNLIEKIILLDSSSKVICLIRDPRAVIYSQMTAKKELLEDYLFGNDKNKEEIGNYFGLYKWIEFYKLSYKLKKLYPNNIIIVSYENLLYNTENTIKNIFNFCEILFNNNVIKFIKYSKNNNIDTDYSICKNYNTNEKWKLYLDDNIRLNINNNLKNENILNYN